MSVFMQIVADFWDEGRDAAWIDGLIQHHGWGFTIDEALAHRTLHPDGCKCRDCMPWRTSHCPPAKAAAREAVQLDLFSGR